MYSSSNASVPSSGPTDVLDPAPELSRRSTGAAIALRLGSGGLSHPSARALALEHPKLLGFIAKVALLGLVALGAVLVALTAAHPSFMTPTANPSYFPAWMAGPLRTLSPWGSLSEQATHTLVTVILSVMYLAYLTVLALSGRLALRWVIGAILVLHVAFLLAPPLQYTDVFNYIDYGRMGVVHHLNPYTTVPMLEPHSDPAFTLSNWHWLLSPYGPLFTLFTYALVPLGVSGAFWTLKLLLCLASLAVVTLVWRCALILGRDPVRALLLVGLNPIVLVWGLGADHNDILMVAPLTFGVYLLIRARAAGAFSPRFGQLRTRAAHECLAAAALVAAGAVKVSAVVAIPIAFAAGSRRRAFLAGFVLAGGVLVLLSLLAFGSHLPGVGMQTELVTDVGPANLLGWMLGQGGETDALRIVLSVLAAGFVLSAAVLSSRPGKDWIALAGASLFVVWVSTSWFAPWYVVWILPFAALAERKRLMLCVLAFGIYILVAFGPEVTPLLQSLHFNPFGSGVGREHNRLISHLVQ